MNDSLFCGIIVYLANFMRCYRGKCTSRGPQVMNALPINDQGWAPDPPDAGGPLYRTSLLPREIRDPLPSKIDLRAKPYADDAGNPYLPTPYTQAPHINACTANALTSAFTFEIKRQGLQPSTFSRLFIYYLETLNIGQPGNETGVSVRDGVDALASDGSCQDAEWLNYDTYPMPGPPPQPIRDQAKQYLKNNGMALAYFRLDNANINELKTCLAAGHPFVFGFLVFQSFNGANNGGKGLVPMPKKNGDPQIGSHTIIAVGYDDARFTVRSSWGLRDPNTNTVFGDQGDYYMPYEYLTGSNDFPDGLAGDFWTLRLTKIAGA